MRLPINRRGAFISMKRGGSSTSTLGDDTHHFGNGVPHNEQPYPIGMTCVQAPVPLNAIPIAVDKVPSSSPPMAATTMAANNPVFVADLVDDAEEGVVHGETAVVDVVSGDVFDIDVSGKIHVYDHVLLGDENYVLVHGIPHSDVTPVRVAPTFKAIEEWFAENEDSDVPVAVEPQIHVPAKRSSGGTNHSKVKRARSSTPTSKDMRNTKAGMSSSKNSLAAVDKQPRLGK
ncbi:hypothetical protein GQ457_18G008320 [Hibiscus cannabinus]